MGGLGLDFRIQVHSSNVPELARDGHMQTQGQFCTGGLHGFQIKLGLMCWGNGLLSQETNACPGSYVITSYAIPDMIASLVNHSLFIRREYVPTAWFRDFPLNSRPLLMGKKAKRKKSSGFDFEASQAGRQAGRQAIK